MRVQGACLCGQVAFEAEVEPTRTFVCHCSDCQTQSGAFRAVVLADPASFALTSGALKFWEKRAESGRTRRLAFCPECGTAIYGGPGEGETGSFSLRVGTLRQRAELPPVAQLWCRSAQDWVARVSELPRIDTQPGG